MSGRKHRWSVLLIAIVTFVVTTPMASATSADDMVVVKWNDGYSAEYSPCTGEFVEVVGPIRIAVDEKVRQGGAEFVELGFWLRLGNDSYVASASTQQTFDAISDEYRFPFTLAWALVDGSPQWETRYRVRVVMEDGVPAHAWGEVVRSRCL